MNKYYKKDPRIPIALALLPAVAALVWIVIAMFTFLVSLEIAIVSLITACVLLLKFADMFVAVQKQKIVFDKISIDCQVIYGNIEDIEMVDKFRFFSSDMGGIFRSGDSIIVGSAKGEKVVKLNQFLCEKVVNGTHFGNHLIIVMPDNTFGFFPVWIGSDSDQPKSQAERVEWAFGEIQEMIEQ